MVEATFGVNRAWPRLSSDAQRATAAIARPAGPAGLEQLPGFSGKAAYSGNGDSQAGADLGSGGAVDAGLAALVTAWPTLSAANKARILAMIQAAK